MPLGELGYVMWQQHEALHRALPWQRPAKCGQSCGDCCPGSSPFLTSGFPKQLNCSIWPGKTCLPDFLWSWFQPFFPSTALCHFCVWMSSTYLHGKKVEVAQSRKEAFPSLSITFQFQLCPFFVLWSKTLNDFSHFPFKIIDFLMQLWTVQAKCFSFQQPWWRSGR